jgi:hypothetical protein
MRNSTKYPFRYSWSKILADAIWFTIFMTLLVKVVEALSSQG